MKSGQILESYLPQRSRAIVFFVEDEVYTIVTDFGNISQLTLQEVRDIYKPIDEYHSPDCWLQNKVCLINQLIKRFPALEELVDFDKVDDISCE